VPLPLLSWPATASPLYELAVVRPGRKSRGASSGGVGRGEQWRKEGRQ